MTDNTAKTVVPILKQYPVRPDNSINLTPEAVRALGWQAGQLCQISVDLTNGRIIIEKAA